MLMGVKSIPDMTDFTFLFKCNSCLIFAQKTEIPLAAVRLAGGGGPQSVPAVDKALTVVGFLLLWSQT